MSGPKRRGSAQLRTKPCTRCKWPYPDDGTYMAPFVRSSGGITVVEDMCPICALEESNMIHGEQATTFHGEHAEWMRLNAVAWREQHPELKP